MKKLAVALLIFLMTSFLAVGYFYGGGNNGKDVLTVNAYSWTATAVVTASK